MSLDLLFHYLLLNMFQMLIHPSSGACDFLMSYFMGCIALVRCVLVLRCGLAGVVWCGIRMQAEASFSLHTDTTPPQPNHTVTPTHIEPELLQPAYGYHTTPAKPHRNTNTHRTRAIQPMK